MQVLFCVYGEGLQVLSWNSRVRTDENHGTPGYKVYWSSHLHLRDGSRDAYKGEQKCTQDRGGEKLKERSHLEYRRVNRGIILKYALKK